MSNNKKHDKVLTIATLAVLSLAFIFAGPSVAVNQLAFAQYAEGTQARLIEVNNNNGNGNEVATTATDNYDETSDAGPNDEAATTETTPTQQEGNAAFAIEQVLDIQTITAECLAQFDAAVGNTVQLVFVEQNPEVAQAIDTEAQAIAVEATTEVSSEVQQDVDAVVAEVEQNDTEVAAAVEQNVNETAVIATAAENAIVEEIIEIGGFEAEVDAAQDAALDAVQSGATAEEAVSVLQENLTTIAENIEVTPEDVAIAADNVQNDNVVVEELGSAVVEEEQVESTGPIDANESSVATTTTTAQVDSVVEETVTDATPVIAEQTGQDINTIRALLDAALANIQAAQEQIG